MQSPEYVVGIKGINPEKALLLPITPDQSYHNNKEFSVILEYVEEKNLNVILIIYDRALIFQMDGMRTSDGTKSASEKLKKNWITVNLETKNKELYERLKKNERINVYGVAEFDEECKIKYKKIYSTDFKGNNDIQDIYHQSCSFLLKSDPSRPILAQTSASLFPQSSGSAYILTPAGFFYVEDVKSHDVFTERDRITDSVSIIENLTKLIPYSVKELSHQELEIITSTTKHKHNNFKVAVQEARNNFCENSAESNKNNPSFKKDKALQLSEEYILNECISMHLWGNVGYKQMAYPMNLNKTNQKIFNCVKVLKKKIGFNADSGMELLDLSVSKVKKIAENARNRKNSPSDNGTKNTPSIMISERYSPPRSPTKKISISPPDEKTDKYSPRDDKLFENQYPYLSVSDKNNESAQNSPRLSSQKTPSPTSSTISSSSSDENLFSQHTSDQFYAEIQSPNYYHPAINFQAQQILNLSLQALLNSIQTPQEKEVAASKGIAASNFAITTISFFQQPPNNNLNPSWQTKPSTPVNLTSALEELTPRLSPSPSNDGH